MTEQHECEHSWHVFELSIDGMFCTKGCRGRLSREEMECRLNEYETLKKATETLSTELVREELGSYAQGWTGWDKLRIAAWEYADILEGNNENERR